MLSTVRPAAPVRKQDAQPQRLIVVSNRGPLEHSIDADGRIRAHPAPGGVAVALGEIAQTTPLSWIAAPATDADRVVAITGASVKLGLNSCLRFVDVPEQALKLHYETYSNPVLWFLQHGMASLLQRPDLTSEIEASWRDGYVPVNRHFADAVIEQLDADPDAGRVMFHDYHLYLAPAMVREARPEATLQHFVHIPWPRAHVWSLLPTDQVVAICRGLLGCDSVVFQTEADVDAFLATCAIFLAGEADVAPLTGEVRWDGREVRVWANPISVDVAALEADAASPTVQHYHTPLRSEMAERTIVRIDRLDPSKNIEAGFLAYARLLAEHLEWQGRVRMLAFLVPSRGGIDEYRLYAERVLHLVDEINDRFSTESWSPVKVFFEQNRSQALAALGLYDVLLVNSVADGMNLVAKEGAVLNRRDGVLVLSRTAGAFEELRRGALGVEPADVFGTSAALHEALTMSAHERKERAEILRNAVSYHQLGDWLRLQLKDLAVTDYVKQLQAG